MTWLTWRQYRAQLAVGTAILAALCLLLAACSGSLANS